MMSIFCASVCLQVYLILADTHTQKDTSMDMLECECMLSFASVYKGQ